jgi:nicotinate phosphoribosyltransferase
MNTPTSSLQTDFYQLTMSYANLILGIAGEITGFESFYRHPKSEVAGDNGFYIFSGEQAVKNFMTSVLNEIKDPSFFDSFWDILSPKIDDPDSSKYRQAKSAFNDISKDFSFTVVPDGTKVYPKMPVFQFKGPRMIGQLIETPITNIINGRTGKETFSNFFNNSKILNQIEYSLSCDTSYCNKLISRALEYRNATDKILLEAGFRRSPSFNIAFNASQIALDVGWDGTSNTSFYKDISPHLIGGTMAHAFIMSFENELDAFKAWNQVFPNSTILIDTYDTLNAVRLLIDNDIKPSAVRIDSDPIEQLAFDVRSILDSAGWTDVKIFLSGDITPEKLIQWENNNVPFDICMAGTKYVNLDYMHSINAGFVYKIVVLVKSLMKINYVTTKSLS